jgi:transposase
MEIPKTKRQEKMEKRRLEGCRMLEQGYRQAEVARKLKVSGAAVSKWEKRRQAGRVLAQRPACTEHRLKDRQLERLQVLLCRGAQKAGHADGLWTLGRVARLIEKHFGVSYHPGHVWRVMRRAGWSCQKPVRRAVERDEAAIERWKKRKWPRIKKKPEPSEG